MRPIYILTYTIFTLCLLTTNAFALNCEESAQPAFPEPPAGERITFHEGKPIVPNNPVLPWIYGDGIGPEISAASRVVLDEAIALAYKGQRKISWYQIPVGREAHRIYGNPLPKKSLAALRYWGVGYKGPLETPIGEGFRSLNVTMRQALDLYSCERPVCHLPNVPSPLLHPERVNMTIFRENTEDIYMGIEFPAGTREAELLRHYINELLLSRDGENANLLPDVPYALGIKPISEAGSKRIMRRAMNYAMKNNIKDVTIVHKGNIQKYTEGAFRNWSYEVALNEYRDKVITEEELKAQNWQNPEGRIVVKDRIADNMFQQTKLRPENYGLIVTPNLNGDYLSDDLAALVGGLGVVGGANIGDSGALFEPTHGTGPDIMGQNKANPTAMLQSGIMMLEYLGWNEAAALVLNALVATFHDRVVTGDLKEMEGARIVGTREFAEYVRAKMVMQSGARLNSPEE